MKTKEYPERIHIRVTREEKKAWKRYARTCGLTLSELIRRALPEPRTR